MKRLCLIGVFIPALTRSLSIANCARKGETGKVRMSAQNAKLKFPGISDPIGAQNNNVDNFGKILKNPVSKSASFLPSFGGTFKDLIKHAFDYLLAYREDEFHAVITKHELRKFYNEYTEEMDEIGRSLQTIRTEFTGTEFQLHLCIKRCGNLLTKFENNLNHALVITALFDELCLLYITVGLAEVEYHRSRDSAKDMINRFRKLEVFINKFKEKCVEQRIDMIKQWKDPNGTDLSYSDELRDDMETVYIDTDSVMNEKLIARVEQYKNELNIIYNNYFDRMLIKILYPVMARIVIISKK